jgi:Bifunctional DNA primase/polymerase, N-terminal
MSSVKDRGDAAAQLNSDSQRNRRKIARDVAALYDDIARETGFEPIERRTAFAISMRLYERSGQACNTPRGVSLSAIGTGLTARSDGEEARAKTAQRNVSALFNHAIPRTGFQILSRFKAEEDSGRPHEYSDHLMPVAAFFSELLAEEVECVLSSKELDRKAKRKKIEETRGGLITEALDYLPKCEAELITPQGEVYAYVSAPEAKAYCAKNRDFTVRAFEYSPPAQEEQAKRPLCGADFVRLRDRAVRQAVDQILDEIAERNSPEEARRFWRTELLPSLQRAGASWTKVAGVAGVETEEEREEELIHASDLSGAPLPGSAQWFAENFDFEPESDAAEPVEKTTADEELTPDKLSGVPVDNSQESSDLKNGLSEIEPVENPPVILVGSINFDESLEAAIFYAKDGWPVLPICNFDPERGRCTATWHPEDCAGKKPLVKGKGNPVPGDGYTAATRDLDQIRRWYRGEFRSAGVGLRLDGKALIDADLKDGGPSSYEFIRDTFELPETLTQATQGGGCHYVFNLLPESQELLKSWTRILDKIALPGIDLKVGKCGLLYAEPTRGKKGVYRWVDPTVEPASLPHSAAEFFHSIRFKDERHQSEKKTARTYSTPSAPVPFDPDQAKYFRDVPRGERHARLLKIARSIRAGGANATQIEAALSYHASRFSDPLNDPSYIARVARECEMKFSAEVSP